MEKEVINNPLPKVLVVDVNAWREDAPSNTLMEVFRCWDPEKLALVYTSSASPATGICSRFFQISERQVLRSVFQPWTSVGREVFNQKEEGGRANQDEAVEGKLRSFSHRHFSTLMRLAREMVWKLGHWKSRALRDFIADFHPDVIFVPIFPYAYMGRIQKYILRHSRVPYVAYLADDNYSYDACRFLGEYLHRFWVRNYVGPLARNCNEMFVIVDKEKEDTDARFGTDSVILTKGIDFENRIFTPTALNNPIRFVYTGSLLIGRERSLALVAEAINRLNRERGKVVAELKIYSQNQPSSSMEKKLNESQSRLCGTVSHQEIETILKYADVVIFVESLFGKSARIAKLSFSTKITDYLSSGKCILAIGSEDIAPIAYFRKYQSALIATNPEEVYGRVKEIVDNPGLIEELGRRAFDCARSHHERNRMNRRFMTTIIRAAKRRDIINTDL